MSGNTHLLMQDDDGHDVAGFVLDWLEANGGRGRARSAQRRARAAAAIRQACWTCSGGASVSTLQARS